MMQKPVAANHTIATPTNPVNDSHHGLCTSDSTDRDRDVDAHGNVDAAFEVPRIGLHEVPAGRAAAVPSLGTKPNAA